MKQIDITQKLESSSTQCCLFSQLKVRCNLRDVTYVTMHKNVCRIYLISKLVANLFTPYTCIYYMGHDELSNHFQDQNYIQTLANVTNVTNLKHTLQPNHILGQSKYDLTQNKLQKFPNQVYLIANGPSKNISKVYQNRSCGSMRNLHKFKMAAIQG